VSQVPKDVAHCPTAYEVYLQHNRSCCFTCAGPTFPSNERTSCDKLFDVLNSAEKRQTTCCMVDREFAISRHATGRSVLDLQPLKRLSVVCPVVLH
jgi:hypothetical protein